MRHRWHQQGQQTSKTRRLKHKCSARWNSRIPRVQTDMFPKAQTAFHQSLQGRARRRAQRSFGMRGASATRTHRGNPRSASTPQRPRMSPCRNAKSASRTSCHANSAEQQWLRREDCKRDPAGVGHHARRPADTLCAVPPPTGADHRSPSHAKTFERTRTKIL